MANRREFVEGRNRARRVSGHAVRTRARTQRGLSRSLATAHDLELVVVADRALTGSRTRSLSKPPRAAIRARRSTDDAGALWMNVIEPRLRARRRSRSWASRAPRRCSASRRWRATTARARRSRSGRARRALTFASSPQQPLLLACRHARRQLRCRAVRARRARASHRARIPHLAHRDTGLTPCRNHLRALPTPTSRPRCASSKPSSAATGCSRATRTSRSTKTATRRSGARPRSASRRPRSRRIPSSKSRRS